MNRVVVLFNDADLRELKRRAGLVPLSTWIRNEVLQSGNESGDGEGNHNQNVPRPRSSALRGRRVASARRDDGGTVRVPVESPRAGTLAGSGSLDGQCLHAKRKGELCYKCDPQLGYPLIAKGKP